MPNAPDVIEIALKTVSFQTAFDAYIEVSLPGPGTQPRIELLVDSGNSTLILPRWEDIVALPNAADYVVLMDSAQEPWGCPAKIVRGPIAIPTVAGGDFTIEACVFYACTADGPDGRRTANFGAACLVPWTASSWNSPMNGVVMMSPIAYGPYPVAEFDYAAAEVTLRALGNQNTDFSSRLYLYRELPSGYALFDVETDLAWMCLKALSLTIEGTPTQWPGNPNAHAVIDTGGTCVFLSDPDDHVCHTAWPDSVDNPTWTQGSIACESISGTIGVVVGDRNGSFSYTIDPARLPPSAEGLTAVMCHECEYMRGLSGLNVGGLSMLFNLLAIDFSKGQIGLKPKR